uniref:CCHC-type domain-containing protein n=1 Tax=Anisakis simplex TaxID=6269 RepID=A0A0M3KHX9_ANISI
LWFGFLDYFSQRFDFASEVIQIRRREPISKLDKGWQGRPIAIEDPFELQHNLSSGVHLRTMIYIQRSFIRSRDHFGRIRLPVRPLNDYTIDTFLNNLFSACHVNSGPPLARNCCHRCKQIGHFVENCPLSQQKGHRRRSGTTTNKYVFHGDGC